MKNRVKLVSILLACAPCLSMYLFLPGTNLCLFFYLCSILATITIANSQYKLEKKWFVMVLGLSLLTLLKNVSTTWFSLSGFINNLWPILIFFATLIFAVPNLNPQTYMRSILIVSVLASVIVIWQRANILATGSYNSEFYLPFFELTEDIAYSPTRPAAFFKEPAHIAIYLLPVFYYSLLSKKFIYTALLGLAILASGSSTGLFLVAVSTVIWLVVDTNGRRNRLMAGLIVVLGILFFIKYQEDIMVENHLEKLTNAESDSSIRLLGALAYFSDFSPMECIFGIGFNQLSNFYGVNGDISNYSNAVLFMTISYGFLGLAVLIYYLVNLYRVYKPFLGFFVILLGVLFSSQLLFHEFLIHLLIFCIMSKKIINSQSV